MRTMVLALLAVVVTKRAKLLPSTRRAKPRQGVANCSAPVHVPDTLAAAPVPFALYSPPPSAAVESSQTQAICSASKAKP